MMVSPSRYSVEFTPAAVRRLRKVPADAALRIRRAVDQLRDDPRPHGAKALTGRSGQLRIRCGDYRIIYTVTDARLVVLVVDLGHRRDVYER